MNLCVKGNHRGWLIRGRSLIPFYAGKLSLSDCQISLTFEGFPTRLDEENGGNQLSGGVLVAVSPGSSLPVSGSLDPSP